MSYAKTYYIKRTSSASLTSKAQWFLANYTYLLPENKQARICEIGPGMGDILATLVQDRGYPNTVGLEIDRDLCDISNNKTPGHCVHVNSVAAHLLTCTDGFDLVIMLHVLEHIDRDEALSLLQAIRSTLRPGGVLLIEVPNAAHPLIGSATFHADFTHRQGYTNSSLDQILAMAGFETRNTGAVRAPGGSVGRWVQGLLQRTANAAITLAMRIYFPGDVPVVSASLFGIGKR